MAVLFGITYFTVICGFFWRLMINTMRLYRR